MLCNISIPSRQCNSVVLYHSEAILKNMNQWDALSSNCNCKNHSHKDRIPAKFNHITPGKDEEQKEGTGTRNILVSKE